MADRELGRHNLVHRRLGWYQFHANGLAKAILPSGLLLCLPHPIRELLRRKRAQFPMFPAPESNGRPIGGHLQLSPTFRAQHLHPDRLPIFFQLHRKHDFHVWTPFIPAVASLFYLIFAYKRIANMGASSLNLAGRADGMIVAYSGRGQTPGDMSRQWGRSLMTVESCIPVIPSANLEKSLRFWVEGLGLTVDREMRHEGKLIGCMVHNSQHLYFWLNKRAGTPLKPENYHGIQLYWAPSNIHATRER
jgi:hypothetical protein